MRCYVATTFNASIGCGRAMTFYMPVALGLPAFRGLTCGLHGNHYTIIHELNSNAAEHELFKMEINQ